MSNHENRIKNLQSEVTFYTEKGMHKFAAKVQEEIDHLEDQRYFSRQPGKNLTDAQLEEYLS